MSYESHNGSDVALPIMTVIGELPKKFFWMVN